MITSNQASKRQYRSLRTKNVHKGLAGSFGRLGRRGEFWVWHQIHTPGSYWGSSANGRGWSPLGRIHAHHSKPGKLKPGMIDFWRRKYQVWTPKVLWGYFELVIVWQVGLKPLDSTHLKITLSLPKPSRVVNWHSGLLQAWSCIVVCLGQTCSE